MCLHNCLSPWNSSTESLCWLCLPLLLKVRKRSKACRAGLRETDELVSINDVSCGTLSHAEAMNLIDSGRGTLHLRIKRSEWDIIIMRSWKSCYSFYIQNNHFAFHSGPQLRISQWCFWVGPPLPVLIRSTGQPWEPSPLLLPLNRLVSTEHRSCLPPAASSGLRPLQTVKLTTGRQTATQMWQHKRSSAGRDDEVPVALLPRALAKPHPKRRRLRKWVAMRAHRTSACTLKHRAGLYLILRERGLSNST